MAEETKEKDLLAEYELPSSKLEPALDFIEQAEPKSEEKKTRDEKGRFVKKTEDAPAEPPPAEPAKQPAKHSKLILRLAAEHGLSQEEIDETDPAELRELLLAQLASKRSAVEPEPAAAPPAPVELGINEDDFDPAIVKVLKSQAQELAALKSELAQAKNERAAETFQSRADAALLRLGDKLLGEGSGSELEHNSSEYRRRIAVLREAADLAGPKATQEQVIKRIPQAHRSLFGVPAKQEAAKEEAEKTQTEIERWRNAGLAAPTNREGAPLPKGTARAERAVAKKLRDRGITDFEGGNEEDGLPG